MKRTKVTILFTGLMGLFLSACVPPPAATPPQALPASRSIPFASLMQSEAPGANQEEAVIFFAGSSAEAEALGPELNDASMMEQIMGVNFAEAIAVVVVRGQMPSTGYGIAVQSLALADNEVAIQAELTDPGSDQMTGAALTFPSEILQINRKDIELTPGMTWTLNANGDTMAQAQYPR